MTDRPIIFSPPMILALLAGRKTMTRRLAWHLTADSPVKEADGSMTFPQSLKPTIWQKVCTGDRLWVKTGRFGRRDESTITLIVTATRIERLQDISDEDARAEGVTVVEGGLRPSEAFIQLWCHLHGDDAWQSNPEVVAITFRVIKAGIDTLEAT